MSCCYWQLSMSVVSFQENPSVRSKRSDEEKEQKANGAIGAITRRFGVTSGGSCATSVTCWEFVSAPSIHVEHRIPAPAAVPRHARSALHIPRIVKHRSIGDGG